LFNQQQPSPTTTTTTTTTTVMTGRVMIRRVTTGREMMGRDGEDDQ